jgi:hypothetical protein
MHGIIVEQAMYKPGHEPHLCQVKKKLDTFRIVEFWPPLCSICMKLEALVWICAVEQHDIGRSCMPRYHSCNSTEAYFVACTNQEVSIETYESLTF